MMKDRSVKPIVLLGLGDALVCWAFEGTASVFGHPFIRLIEAAIKIIFS